MRAHSSKPGVYVTYQRNCNRQQCGEFEGGRDNSAERTKTTFSSQCCRHHQVLVYHIIAGVNAASLHIPPTHPTTTNHPTNRKLKSRRATLLLEANAQVNVTNKYGTCTAHSARMFNCSTRVCCGSRGDVDIGVLENQVHCYTNTSWMQYQPSVSCMSKFVWSQFINSC